MPDNFDKIEKQASELEAGNWKKYVAQMTYQQYTEFMENHLENAVKKEIKRRKSELDEKIKKARQHNEDYAKYQKILELRRIAEYWDKEAEYSKDIFVYTRAEDLYLRLEDDRYRMKLRPNDQKSKDAFDKTSKELDEALMLGLEEDVKEDPEKLQEALNTLKKPGGSKLKETVLENLKILQDSKVEKFKADHKYDPKKLYADDQALPVAGDRVYSSYYDEIEVLKRKYHKDYQKKHAEAMLEKYNIDINNIDGLPHTETEVPTEEGIKEEIRKKFLSDNKYIFATYGDYVAEYQAQNREENSRTVDALLENFSANESYRNYYDKIVRWKDLMLRNHIWMEDLPDKYLSEDEKSDLENHRISLREFCTKKCTDAINELMEHIELSTYEKAHDNLLQLGRQAGDEAGKNKAIETVKLEIKRDSEVDYTAAGKLLSAVNNLYSMTAAAYDGELEVPNPEVTELNGKKIHRIDARGWVSKHQDGKYVIENGEVAKRKNRKAATYEEQNLRDLPLFSTDPKPSDIEQGDLGDCYLMASLSALAAQDPQKIKDALCDNGDGTVTVRLFNNDREPMFITVDKTIPQKDGNAVYGQNALWVQMMEKAYAASGIKAHSFISYMKSAEDVVKDKQIDFTKIGEGGFMFAAVAHILGTDPGIFFGDYEFKMVTDCSKNTGEYTAQEKEYAKFIQTQISEGRITTASTNHSFDLSKEEIKELEAKGIYDQHAYTLLGIEEENGKFFVKYRNPHNASGLVQTAGEDGKIQETVSKKGGLGRMELREFTRYFGWLVGNTYDLTPTRREKLPEAQDLTRRYGSTVAEIQKTLKASDNILMAMKNSGEFKQFKAAANKAMDAMQEKCPDPGKIRQAMEDLFTNAAAYETYCDNRKKVDPKTASDRAVKRFKAAKITAELQKIYQANEPEDNTYGARLEAESKPKKECSYDRLAEKVNIPTTGWEQLRDAENSVAQPLKDLSPNERQAYYQRICDFLDKNSHRTFSPDKLQGMKPAKKNEYFKEHRKDLETMLAITEHGEEISDQMEKDGFNNVRSEELKTRSGLLKPLMDGVRLVTDPLKYEGLHSSEGGYAEHLKSLEAQMKASAEKIAELNAAKNAPKKASKKI